MFCWKVYTEVSVNKIFILEGESTETKCKLFLL